MKSNSCFFSHCHPNVVGQHKHCKSSNMETEEQEHSFQRHGVSYELMLCLE